MLHHSKHWLAHSSGGCAEQLWVKAFLAERHLEPPASKLGVCLDADRSGWWLNPTPMKNMSQLG